jgi:hypothetical protein
MIRTVPLDAETINIRNNLFQRFRVDEAIK